MIHHPRVYFTLVALTIAVAFGIRRAFGKSGLFPVKPLEETRVTSNFGWRHHPVFNEQRHHNGVDLGAKAGTPIYCAGAGVVLKANTTPNPDKGYGNHVVVDHGEGYTSKYGHMRDVPMVQVGQKVRAGQQLGVVGSTGVSTGPHLHFEIRLNGEPVDPRKFYAEYHK